MGGASQYALIFMAINMSMFLVCDPSYMTVIASICNSKLGYYNVNCIDSDLDMMRRILLSTTSSSSSQHISYKALRGDNIPCPPMSGRSYYNPNCNTASGPANSYSRGCDKFTQCQHETG